MLPDDPRHGTEAGHEQHLRDGETPCDPCIEGDLRAGRRRSKRKTMGHVYTLPLGVENHRKLATLKQKGATWDQLAEWVGIAPSCVWRYIDGGPEHVVYARTWQRIYQFTPGRIVTPVGVTRRLQALSVLGYSPALVAAESGVSESTLRQARIRVRRFLAQRVSDDIADTYERLCMEPRRPGDVSDRRGASRVRSHAARAGWAPPLAWDDIDNPDEQPNLGDFKRDKLGRPVVRDRVIEDADWMAAADETLTSVCRRLGLLPETLYQTCRRADRLDLYATLSRREPDGDLAIDMRALKTGAA